MSRVGGGMNNTLVKGSLRGRCNRGAGICELSTNLFQRLTNVGFGSRMGKLVRRNKTAKGKVGKNKVAGSKGWRWWWFRITPRIDVGIRVVVVLVAVSVTRVN